MGFEFEFVGRIRTRGTGMGNYTVLCLPEQLASQPPFAGQARVRVQGEIEEIPFSAAWQSGEGGKFLYIPKRVLKERQLAIGDWVSVRFDIDDPDRVEEPLELTVALAQDKRLQAVWQQLTPGKRRGLAYRISSARQPATRQRRVEELLQQLRTP